MGRKWWQNGVIYQIYPRSFCDSNGDGIGDIKGILSKLDYLNGARESLGVDAIWISPFYPSPLDDFGYDISDYVSVDPQYGTLDDVELLIEECGKRNIRVLLDLVVNHTSDRHPWFVASRNSRADKKRDWYIWADGKNGKPPNNWQSRFGGSAWEFDEETNQFYMHSFLKSQPDLNWRNAEVRNAVNNIVSYWLKKGVAGFRLDVFNFYFKDEKLRNNPLRLKPSGLIYSYDRYHHVYDKDRPELYEAVKQLRALTDSFGDCILLGEVDSDSNTKSAALCYGANCDGLHLAFNFDFMNCRWRAQDFRNVIVEWEKAVPTNAWPTYVLSNHDQPRHMSRFGNSFERARVASTMLLTLRGTPVLYYGEEIGMPQSDIRPQNLLDPPGKKWWPLYAGRDGCRTPMQWTSGYHAGFSNAPTTWLPVDQSFKHTNVEASQNSHNSLLNHYKKLLALRRASSALTEGSFELFGECETNVLGYWRRSELESVLVLLNFSEKPADVRLSNFAWQLLYGELTSGPQGKTLLPANGVALLKRVSA